MHRSASAGATTGAHIHPGRLWKLRAAKRLYVYFGARVDRVSSLIRLRTRMCSIARVHESWANTWRKRVVPTKPHVTKNHDRVYALRRKQPLLCYRYAYRLSDSYSPYEEVTIVEAFQTLEHIRHDTFRSDTDGQIRRPLVYVHGITSFFNHVYDTAHHKDQQPVRFVSVRRRSGRQLVAMCIHGGTCWKPSVTPDPVAKKASCMPSTARM